MTLSESARREVFREFEHDYWRLINMRSERERLLAEIEVVRARRDALLHLVAAYTQAPSPAPTREEPSR